MSGSAQNSTTTGWQFGLSSTLSPQQPLPTPLKPSNTTSSHLSNPTPTKSFRTPNGKKNKALIELMGVVENRSLSQHDQLHDSFDLTSPLPSSFDSSILIDPFTFCLCGTPCACVVMEYIRLNDWKRLHFHLLHFSQDFLNFLKMIPVMSLNLNELVTTTDKLSTMPLLNQTMIVNNINKAKPVGKRIDNIEMNHLYSNNYTLDATNNTGSGNITDSVLYRTGSVIGLPPGIGGPYGNNQGNSNHLGMNAAIGSNHNNHHPSLNTPINHNPNLFATLPNNRNSNDDDDDDDYDPFDDKYDEDDNITRNFDFFHKVVNFSSLNEPYIPPNSIHSSFLDNNIGYNHHPLSIGSVLYQYDPSMIPLHQNHILTTITNEIMEDATNVVNNAINTQTNALNQQIIMGEQNNDDLSLLSQLSASSSTPQSPQSPQKSHHQPSLLQQHSFSPHSQRSPLIPLVPSYPFPSTPSKTILEEEKRNELQDLQQQQKLNTLPHLLPPPSQILTNPQLSYTIQKTRRQRPAWLQSRPQPHFLQALKLNNNDITPVMLAVFLRQPKTLEVLVYHGASLNTTIPIPQQTIHSLHHPRMRFTALDMAIMYLYSQERGLNDFTMILTLLLIFQTDCLTWTIDHSGHNIFQRLILSYNPYAPSSADEMYFPLPSSYHSYLHWTIDLLLHKSTWFDPYHRNNLGQLLSDVISRQFTMHTLIEQHNNNNNISYSSNNNNNNNTSNPTNPTTMNFSLSGPSSPASYLPLHYVNLDSAVLERVYNEHNVLTQQSRLLNLAIILSMKALTRQDQETGELLFSYSGGGISNRDNTARGRNKGTMNKTRKNITSNGDHDTVSNEASLDHIDESTEASMEPGLDTRFNPGSLKVNDQRERGLGFENGQNGQNGQIIVEKEALYKTKQLVKRKHNQLSHFTDLFLSPPLLQLTQHSNSKESGTNSYLAQPALEVNQSNQPPNQSNQSANTPNQSNSSQTGQDHISHHHRNLINSLLPKPTWALNSDEKCLIICNRTIVSPAKQWLFFHFLKKNDPFHPINLQLLPKLPTGFIPSHFLTTTPVESGLNNNNNNNGESKNKNNQSSTNPSTVSKSNLSSNPSSNNQFSQQYQIQLTKQRDLHPHHHINDNMFISPTTNKTLLMLMIDDDQSDIATLRDLQKEQLVLLERLRFEYTYLTDRYLFFHNQSLLISPATTASSNSSSNNNNNTGNTNSPKNGNNNNNNNENLFHPLSDSLPPLNDLTSSPFFTISPQHTDPRIPLQMHNPLLHSKTKILIVLTTINIFLIQHRISKRILFIDLLLSTLRQAPIESSNDGSDSSQQQHPTSSIFEMFGGTSTSSQNDLNNAPNDSTLSFSLALFVQLEHHDHLGYTAFDYLSSLNNTKQVFDLVTTAYLSYPAAFNTKHRLLAAKYNHLHGLAPKGTVIPSSSSSSSSPVQSSKTIQHQVVHNPSQQAKQAPPSSSKPSKSKEKNNTADYVLGADYVMLLVPNQYSEDSLDIAIFNQDRTKQQILSTLNIHHARNANGAAGSGDGDGPDGGGASPKGLMPRFINRKNGIVDGLGNDVSSSQYRPPRLSIGSMEETTELAIAMRKVKVLTFIQRKYVMLRRVIKNVKKFLSEQNNYKNNTKRSGGLFGIFGGSLGSSKSGLDGGDSGAENMSRNSVNLSCSTSYLIHNSANGNHLGDPNSDSHLYSPQLLYTALLSLPWQFRQRCHHYSLIDVLRGIISTPNVPSNVVNCQIVTEATKNASMLLYEYKWWKITLPLSKAINPILTHNIASNTLQAFIASQGIDLQSYLTPFRTFYLPFSQRTNILMGSLGEAIASSSTPGRILPHSYFNNIHAEAESGNGGNVAGEGDIEEDCNNNSMNNNSLVSSSYPIDLDPNHAYNSSSYEYNNVYLLLNMLMKTWKLRETVSNDIDLNLYYNYHETRPIDVVPWVLILLSQSNNPNIARYTLPNGMLYPTRGYGGSNNDQNQQTHQNQQSHSMNISRRGSTSSIGGQFNWIFENTNTPRGIFQLILRLFPNAPTFTKEKLRNSPQNGEKGEGTAITANNGLHFDPETNRLITDQEFERLQSKGNGSNNKNGDKNDSNGVFHDQSDKNDQNGKNCAKSPEVDELILRSTLLRRFFTIFAPSPVRIWDEYLERDVKRAKMVDYEYTPTAKDIYTVERFFSKHQRFLTKEGLITNDKGEIVGGNDVVSSPTSSVSSNGGGNTPVGGRNSSNTNNNSGFNNINNSGSNSNHNNNNNLGGIGNTLNNTITNQIDHLPYVPEKYLRPHAHDDLGDSMVNVSKRFEHMMSCLDISNRLVKTRPNSHSPHSFIEKSGGFASATLLHSFIPKTTLSYNQGHNFRSSLLTSNDNSVIWGRGSSIGSYNRSSGSSFASSLSSFNNSSCSSFSQSSFNFITQPQSCAEATEYYLQHNNTVMGQYVNRGIVPYCNNLVNSVRLVPSYTPSLQSLSSHQQSSSQSSSSQQPQSSPIPSQPLYSITESNSYLIDDIAKYSTNVVLNYIKKRLDTLVDPTYLNSNSYRDMVSTLFCSDFHTIPTVHLHNQITKTSLPSTNLVFTNHFDVFSTRFQFYTLFSALKSIFNLDVVTFFTIREQYSLLLERKHQIESVTSSPEHFVVAQSGITSQSRTRQVAQNGQKGQHNNKNPQNGQNYPNSQQNAANILTIPKLVKEPSGQIGIIDLRTTGTTNSMNNATISSSINAGINNNDNNDGPNNDRSNHNNGPNNDRNNHNNNTKPLSLNSFTSRSSLSSSSTIPGAIIAPVDPSLPMDRREQEKLLVSDLQSNSTFQQNTPLLINSINQLLIGWTYALLLLDSNPNTFTYTPVSGGNPSVQQNSIRTVNNEQISIPLTAIQIAVRSFCQRTAGSTSVAMANGKNVSPDSQFTVGELIGESVNKGSYYHPDDNFAQPLNNYSSYLIKLLIQFGAYPYPQSPAIPTVLIKSTTASKAIRKGVSSLTLSQLLFTKSTLPQLQLLEFIHTIDFMHINTPTGVTVYNKDPAALVSEELKKVAMLKQINASSLTTPPSQQLTTSPTNNINNISLYGSGYTPLHLAARHGTSQSAIIKFLLLNGAYRLIIDDEKSSLPLMLLVQNSMNQSALSYFLKFDGVFSLFYRVPHKVGFCNNPDNDKLGLVLEDANNINLFTNSTKAAKSIASSALINPNMIISSVKSSILINNGYPSVTDAWFTDGFYDYYPIIATPQSSTDDNNIMVPSGSSSNRCVVECAKNEYQDLLKSTILKWKNQAQRRYLTTINNNSDNTTISNKVDNIDDNSKNKNTGDIITKTSTTSTTNNPENSIAKPPGKGSVDDEDDITGTVFQEY